MEEEQPRQRRKSQKRKLGEDAAAAMAAAAADEEEEEEEAEEEGNDYEEEDEEEEEDATDCDGEGEGGGGEICCDRSQVALGSEVRAQVEVLDRCFSWCFSDRIAAKRATHVLAELAKNEEVVNVIVEGGAVPALVRHLQETPLAPNEGGERPFEHEVEKGSAFALGLLAVKINLSSNFVSEVLQAPATDLDVEESVHSAATTETRSGDVLRTIITDQLWDSRS